MTSDPEVFTFTRAELIDALARLETRVMTTGPLAGKVLADSFADALIQALADRQGREDISPPIE